KALIISAQDGLDEVSLGAPTQVLVVTPDGNETHLWHPEMTFGMKMIPPSEIRVDSPQESARRIRAVFGGRPENQADEAYIVVNAAAALWLTDKADNMINSVSLAREIIQSGTTLNLLESYTAKSLM
ncbi:MAG: anthranilate phosphoribosyltransferase, partial [Planctomycetota bacterium]